MSSSSRGGGSLPVTIQWTATEALTGTLELVHNGVVVASQQAVRRAGHPGHPDHHGAP